MQDPTNMTNDGPIINNTIMSVLSPMWVYKLNNLERITCIDMTNDYKFLSISCWDGKVFVFCAEEIDEEDDKEERNVNWLPYNPESLWESSCQFGIEPYFPTFVTHYYEKNAYALLVVTTPNSRIIRIFDLINGKLYCKLNDNIESSGMSLHGLITVNDTNK